MPASDRGLEEVLPAMNQRSSPTTARRNTRLVVRRGRIGVGSLWPSSAGFDRENFSWGGANIAFVPVPVLKLLV